MKGRQLVDLWLKEEEEADGHHAECFWYRDGAAVSADATDADWVELAHRMRKDLTEIEAKAHAKHHEGL